MFEWCVVLRSPLSLGLHTVPIVYVGFQKYLNECICYFACCYSRSAVVPAAVAAVAVAVAAVAAAVAAIAAAVAAAVAVARSV